MRNNNGNMIGRNENGTLRDINGNWTGNLRNGRLYDTGAKWFTKATEQRDAWRTRNATKDTRALNNF